MIKNTSLIILVLTMTACSTTMTGPVTGNKYNLDVGCTEDMRAYREERRKTMDDIEREKMDKLDLECSKSN